MTALDRRHQARFRTTYRIPRAVTPPGGRTTVILLAIVWFGLNFSLQFQAEKGGADTSGVVVETGADAKGNKYADAVFTTLSGRKVRASIKEGDWAAMPKVGERVRVWYQPEHPADSAVDARLPGLGVSWKVHALIWLITIAVVLTTAYRWRNEDTRPPRDLTAWPEDTAAPHDLTVRRSPDDAPPLDR